VNRKYLSSFLQGCVLLLLLVCSCTGPVTHEPVTEKQTTPFLNLIDLEQKIHVRIHSERLKKGLSPLVWNSALSRIARWQSQDIVLRKYIGHISPEGRDFPARSGPETRSLRERKTFFRTLFITKSSF
jgi:hypothetical protein